MRLKKSLILLTTTGCLLTTSCSLTKTDENISGTEKPDTASQVHTDTFEALDSSFYLEKNAETSNETEDNSTENIEDDTENVEDSTENIKDSTETHEVASVNEDDNYIDEEDDPNSGIVVDDTTQFLNLYTGDDTREYAAADYDDYDDKLKAKKTVKYDSVANLINREYDRLKQDEIGEDTWSVVYSPISEAGSELQDQLTFFLEIRGEYYVVTYYKIPEGAYMEHDDTGVIPNDYLHLSDGFVDEELID